MELIFFCLQPSEETPHPIKFSFAVDDGTFVLLFKVFKRDVCGDTPAPTEGHQILEFQTGDSGPWFDSPLVQGFGFIRHHQIEIDINDPTEPSTANAGANRGVE